MSLPIDEQAMNCFCYLLMISKVSREGIEPLAATPLFFGAWFTAKLEGHDPLCEMDWESKNQK